jgi:sulfur carrier protein
MRITLNGSNRETAATSLADLIEAEGLPAAVVATAVNGEFVPRGNRAGTPLRDGDSVEIVSPRQGG